MYFKYHENARLCKVGLAPYLLRGNCISLVSQTQTSVIKQNYDMASLISALFAGSTKLGKGSKMIWKMMDGVIL